MVELLDSFDVLLHDAGTCIQHEHSLFAVGNAGRTVLP